MGTDSCPPSDVELGGGCCHRYLLDIVRFLAPSQTDSAVIFKPGLQPSGGGSGCLEPGVGL